MDQSAIRIENISKRYSLHRNKRYVALRDILTETFRAPLRAFTNRKNGAKSGSHDGYFWALRNVSLEFQKGEIVGLIGRNGAGKTTLLKILTRITRPTSGRAAVQGRVGSLLEVGTGFHPELSGRENVFFYGAILGMGKREIERKYDEIVEFAGVEQFLDTPLKHFSTGMQSRLAFAVAAHLDPEILLVDEVLAVGDLEFQRKCLGRMEKVSQGGRTVVLVSHQLNQIRRLCKKVVWMEKGEVREVGSAPEVTGAYEAALLSRENSGSRSASSNAKAQFLWWEVAAPQDENPHILRTLGPAKFKFVVEVTRPIDRMHTGLVLYNSDNQLMWGTSHNMSTIVEPGIIEFEYELAFVPLKPGAYHFRFGFADHSEVIEVLQCAPDLLIDTEPLGHLDENWAGLLNVPCEFSIHDQSGAQSDLQGVRGRMWT